MTVKISHPFESISLDIRNRNNNTDIIIPFVRIKSSIHDTTELNLSPTGGKGTAKCVISAANRESPSWTASRKIGSIICLSVNLQIQPGIVAENKSIWTSRSDLVLTGLSSSSSSISHLSLSAERDSVAFFLASSPCQRHPVRGCRSSDAVSQLREAQSFHDRRNGQVLQRCWEMGPVP